MSEWPKVCACRRSFTIGQWKTLGYVGDMGDEVETLELRNCPCGSTIAQSFGALGVSVTLAHLPR